MSRYKSHSSAVVELGKPFSILSPSVLYGSVGIFEWTDDVSSIDNDTEVADIKFDMQEVKSVKDFYSLMSVDFSIENTFSFGSAGASLNYEKEIEFSENNMVFVFYGKKVNKPISKSGQVDLSKKGVDLLESLEKNGNPLNFLISAGTEIVNSITTGTIISVIYNFKLFEGQRKGDLKARLGVGWTTGNAHLDFRALQRESNLFMTVDTKACQSGAKKSDALNKNITDLITVDPGNLQEIKNVIRTILNDIGTTDQKENILEFNTMPLNLLPKIQSGNSSDAFNHFYNNLPLTIKKIDSLSTVLKYNKSLLETAEYLKENINSSTFKENAERYLDNKISEYTSNINKIYTVYAKLNQDFQGQKEIPYFITEKIDYSQVILRNVYLLKWEYQYDIRCNGGHGSMTSFIFPVVSISIPEAIEIMELYADSQLKIRLDKTNVQVLFREKGSFQNIWVQKYSDNMPVLNCETPVKKKMVAHFRVENEATEGKKNYILKVINKDGTSFEVGLGNVRNYNHVSAPGLTTILNEIKNIPFEHLDRLKCI